MKGINAAMSKAAVTAAARPRLMDADGLYNFHCQVAGLGNLSFGMLQPVLSVVVQNRNRDA